MARQTDLCPRHWTLKPFPSFKAFTEFSEVFSPGGLNNTYSNRRHLSLLRVRHDSKQRVWVFHLLFVTTSEVCHPLLIREGPPTVNDGVTVPIPQSPATASLLAPHWGKVARCQLSLSTSQLLTETGPGSSCPVFCGGS